MRISTSCLALPSLNLRGHAPMADKPLVLTRDYVRAPVSIEVRRKLVEMGRPLPIDMGMDDMAIAARCASPRSISLRSTEPQDASPPSVTIAIAFFCPIVDDGAKPILGHQIAASGSSDPRKSGRGGHFDPPVPV